ncbi:MAG: hypothetical protein HYV09_20275 [Deltaproteobacteria bacterium]|nr:hypothetical protein [Deltaproteobacteria bacterium]
MRSVMPVLVVPALVAACGRTSSTTAAPTCIDRDVRGRAEIVATGVSRGEIDGCLVREGAAMDVEIRERLSETDERARATFTGVAALRSHLASIAADARAGGRWPDGLAVVAPLRCYGDCCDLDHPGMVRGRLYLRRVCFAYAGRLSSITFVDVR